MRHLNEGTLRRLIDEPAAITDSQHGHVAGCARCQENLNAVRADAQLTAGVLGKTAIPQISTNRALQRVRARTSVDSTMPRRVKSPASLLARGSGMLRPLSAGVAALTVAGALVWTPAGSLAQTFVSIFQPTQVQAIPVAITDLTSLGKLRHYGTVHISARVRSKPVASLAIADSLSGMKVLAPTAGTDGVPAISPTYAFTPSDSASFTFNAAKAAKHGAPAMPADINGSSLDITVGTSVVSTYKSGTGDIPALVTGQVQAPTVRSTKVTLARLENYILPLVSKHLAAEIRAINNPLSTLPIPVPVNLATGQSVQVNGAPGIEIGDNTGLGSGVVWEKDHIIYGVAGPLTQSQVLTIASAMH